MRWSRASISSPTIRRRRSPAKRCGSISPILRPREARPLGFLLTLALPSDWRDKWLAAFAGGLCADVLAFKCPLIGGDTVATPGPLTLSVTAIGSVSRGRMPRRTGVRPGDRLYVTGGIDDYGGS